MVNYRTPDEVANELRVTRRTVYEWLRTGQLHGRRAGRGWRITEEDLLRFLSAEQQRKGQGDGGE